METVAGHARRRTRCRTSRSGSALFAATAAPRPDRKGSDGQGHRLLPEQPPTDALCRFPQTRIIRWVGRHRGRLQNDHWTTTQALRNALDRPRRQRYHRAALLPDEWPLGGILGDALGQDQLTPTNLSHTCLMENESKSAASGARAEVRGTGQSVG